MARVGLGTASVVAAAAEIADADGLEALTLTRLAAALGVRAPSLYAHVGGLADLRGRLAELGAERLYEVLALAAAGRSGPDALRAVLAGYREFATAHPGLYLAAQGSERRGAALAAAERLVSVMLSVMRGYGLEDDAAVHAVRTVRAAVDGFVSLHSDGGFEMDVPVAESWEWMVDALDRALESA